MSDSENTPQGTARINSERFETQLATVWFAANYYYEASYRHGREYIGVVFHVPNEPDSEKKIWSHRPWRWNLSPNESQGWRCATWNNSGCGMAHSHPIDRVQDIVVSRTSFSARSLPL
jgi:hypothetical protein